MNVNFRSIATEKMSDKKMNFWLYSYTILLMLCKGLYYYIIAIAWMAMSYLILKNAGLQAQTIMPPSNHGHGFEFSSYSEVVTNALYLYGRPLDSLSAGHSNVVGHWIFPFMNFTCSYGRVIKLMFVAKVPINNQIMFVWPEFFLWRRCEYDADGCRDGWLEVQTLSGAGTQPILVYVNGNVGVYEIIDIRDYVNGIGNRSREQYVCIERWPRTPCYSEVDGFVELYVL